METENDDRVLITGDMLQLQTLLSHTGQRAGGGGGRLGYHLMDDAYYPNGDLRTPDVIRILPMAYRQEMLLGDRIVLGDWPFFSWREHRDTRTFKSTVCSAGIYFYDKERRHACHGCDMYYDLRRKDEKGKWQEGWLTSRFQHSVSLVHFHPYQYLPQTDKTGQVKTRRDGTPFMGWQRGGDIAGAETVPCRKMRWDFGTTYRSLLTDLGKAVFYSCRNCGSSNSIHWEAVVCGNERCEYPIYERGQHALTDKEAKEIDDKANDMYTCEKCGETSFPKKYYACSGCDTPEPATIFDVDIRLAMVTTSTPGKKSTKALQLVGWGDPRPIALPLDKLSQEEAGELLTPFDLATLLQPTSIADQVNILGARPASASPRTPSNSSREYGK